MTEWERMRRETEAKMQIAEAMCRDLWRLPLWAREAVQQKAFKGRKPCVRLNRAINHE